MYFYIVAIYISIFFFQDYSMNLRKRSLSDIQKIRKKREKCEILNETIIKGSGQDCYL